MNLLRRVSCFVVFLVGAGYAAAATPLNNVVSDRAAIILSFHDVPSLVSGWDRSPWAKTWNDEQVKKYFAPMRTQMKVDEWDTIVKQKTGYTISDLLGFATGDAIVSVPDFDFAQTTAGKTSQVLLGIDIGGNASKLETLFAKGVKDENATEETSDFAGVTVHIIHPVSKDADHPVVPTVWAIVEGKWFLSPSKEAVLAAIDGVHNGGVDNAWGRSERWARLQQRTGDAQVVASLNVESIYPLIKAALETKLKNDGPAPAGPFAFDAQTVLTALGFDTWREAYFTAKLGEDSTDFHGGLSYSSLRGLTKLLAYHDGPVPTPNFISSKFVSVSTNKLSAKEAYDALEEMLAAISPALSGLAQGQVRSINKQLGIDLKRDFLGSLGDTVIVARLPASTPASAGAVSLSDLDQFFAFSLQNSDTFSNAIDSFKRLVGPQADTLFKTRDFLGQKITTFQPGGENVPGAKAFNYSIAKGYFFLSVGSASAIESALRSLAQDEKTLWTNKDVAAALAQVPAGANGFEYEDIGALVNSFFKTLSDTSSLMSSRAHAAHPVAEPDNSNSDSTADSAPTPVAPEPTFSVDVSAQPDADTISKYWAYGWGYVVRDSSGIHTTSQIVYPK